MLAIRPATAADADAIAALHAASWRDAYRDSMPADYLRDRALADLTEHWRNTDFSAGDVLLVAEEAGALTGFIAIYRGEKHEPSTYLDNLHVAPGRRSGGVGAQLMKAAAEALIGLGETGVYLWLVQGNDAAQRFYERLGGVATERSSKTVFGVPLDILKIEWEDLGAIIRAATAASR